MNKWGGERLAHAVWGFTWYAVSAVKSPRAIHPLPKKKEKKKKKHTKGGSLKNLLHMEKLASAVARNTGS